MKTAILGTGDVAKALAMGFLRDGDEVMMGTRDPSAGRLSEWSEVAEGRAAVGTFADAAAWGDRVVLATKGVVNAEVIAAAGPDRLAGKLVVDTTNPLDPSEGMPPRLVVPPEGSAGEQVQALAPGARVVKCWNIVGNPFMADPAGFEGGPPTMFVCGDHEAAKAEVAALLDAWGWEVSDVGPLWMSRHLESMCIVWVAHGVATGAWSHAFKMLRRP